MYKDLASPVAYWIAMHVPSNGQLLGQLDALYMNNVTGILSRLESGDPSAAEQLLPLVYDELRTLAAARLAREKPG